MKKFIMIIVGVILLTVIGIVVVMSIKNKQTITAEPVSVEPTVSDTTFNTCYSYHQVATTEAPYAVDETLFISTNGNIITGTKQGTQNGPDMTNGYNGSVTGTINGDTITAVFDYIIEGSSNKEQEIYKKTATGLEKLRYPLIQEKGMLVPDTTKEFKIIPYTQIACSSIK